MLNSNFKWNPKTLKKVGISTALITSTVVGYTAVNALDDSANISADDISAVEQVDLLQGGGRGGGGRGGDSGGHGHHDQTLADDAYDPEDLVAVDPEADLNTDLDAEATPEVDVDPEATPEVEPTYTPDEDDVYLDGQYVGDSVQADRWGNMQVVAVIEEGELVQVLIADYPRNTTTSDVITRNALPTLISEAIEAQSADIDIVSSATDSSVAFIESLESALKDALIVTEEATTSESADL